jgi:hypothetical protein
MFMYVNSPNGRTYWLHSVASKNRKMAYFFSKVEENSIEPPSGYIVMFSKKNGMPYLKKVSQ